jgi:putative ABC transport system ATP-binding protein
VPAEIVAASCTDVVKTYWTESGRVEALKGLSAEFPAGNVTAVVGPSGSGKSSLLAILAGFSRATAGRVHLGGMELTSLPRRRLRQIRRRFVGYVFQRPSDNFVPYLTLAEHFEIARRRSGLSVAEEDDIVGLLGLIGRENHFPHELSGGEQQRGAFAQVLLSRPALVACDEPTAELDSASTKELLDSLPSLVELGVAVIVATHDPIVAKKADRVLAIEDGRLLHVEESERMWMRPS